MRFGGAEKRGPAFPLGESGPMIGRDGMQSCQEEGRALQFLVEKRTVMVKKV